jgi:hypothetical protein
MLLPSSPLIFQRIIACYKRSTDHCLQTDIPKRKEHERVINICKLCAATVGAHPGEMEYFHMQGETWRVFRNVEHVCAAGCITNRIANCTCPQGCGLAADCVLWDTLRLLLYRIRKTRVWGSSHGNMQNKRDVKKTSQPRAWLELLAVRFVFTYLVSASQNHNATLLQTLRE